MRLENVDIFVHSSKESNYGTGTKLGLTGDALHMFCFLGYEHKLTFSVDLDTGHGRLILVDNRAVV